ncbi:AAA family ATPase [Candidatus Woesearchaeota archaeon]|nr:AAA family ATPase [Candidatus Woesearchaeota archaeon]
MKKYTICSLRHSAGKTSVIIGMAKSLKKKISYLKPLGDRAHYLNNDLLDYDAELIKSVLNLKQDKKDIVLGFDYSKIRYLFKEQSVKQKLKELSESHKSDILFVEAGRDITYGSYVNLDPLSLAKHMQTKLILVISGDEKTIIDDTTFVKNWIRHSEIDFAGIIITRVGDINEFKKKYMDHLKQLSINIIGILPYEKVLTYPTAEYISDNLKAKVIAGEKGLKNTIKNIFVGAMSTDAAFRKPLFSQENKLIITGGDRSDMILAAIDTDTTAVVLTNGILPPSNIISKASEKNMPLILVSDDTFKAAKKIDDMEVILTERDDKKIELITAMVKKNIDLDSLFS